MFDSVPLEPKYWIVLTIYKSKVNNEAENSFRTGINITQYLHGLKEHPSTPGSCSVVTMNRMLVYF